MDSDNEWDEEIPSWKGVAGTVLLINTYDPINSNVPNIAYRAACEIIRNHMRNTSSQLIGICLYGNDSSSSSPDLENMIQVFPLTVPSLDDYKKLQSVDVTSLPQAKEFKLSDVLWHSNKMFSNCKKLLSSKSVILLTRLDIPPISQDQKPTLKRVVDMVDSGIQLKIVNISEIKYHVDPFYNEFLQEAHKCRDFDMPKPLSQLSDIVKSIQHYSHRHLAVARLCLEIGKNFSIGVGVYNLLQSRTKPKKVIADKDTNKILSRISTSYKVSYASGDNDLPNDGDENGMEGDSEREPRQVPLLKSELLYYQVFGDEKVQFTSEEMKKLRNPFGPPILKLLGFKPSSILSKEKWYMKPCHFLYPSETIIEGSTVPFKAMHQACTEMSVIAICVMCSRVNSRPKIVALSPCTKPLGLDVTIGFDVIPIPFTENVRNVPTNDESVSAVDEAHKLVVTDIVKALHVDYVPDMFESPVLQSLHRTIEALALDEENVQMFTDTTRPPRAKFLDIDHVLFEELFGPFAPAATKRQGTSTSAGTAAKKDKPEPIDEDLLASRIRAKLVDKYKADDLKKILRYHSIPNLKALTGVKKNELVSLVYEHCTSMYKK